MKRCSSSKHYPLSLKSFQDLLERSDVTQSLCAQMKMKIVVFFLVCILHTPRNYFYINAQPNSSKSSFSFHYAKLENTKLPRPTSELSVTLAPAPDGDGDLKVAIYLLGGCIAPYLPQQTKEQHKIQEQYEYVCPTVANSNFAYDADKLVMEERLPMPHSRRHHTSITIGGFIWVCGGRDGNDRIVKQVDVYDSIMDHWITLDTGLDEVLIASNDDKPVANYKVSHHAAFAVGEYLILAGGFTEEYIAVDYTVAINTASSLSQNRLVYNIISSLNQSRGDATAVAYGHGNFIIVGGFSHVDGYCESMSSVEIYDPKEKSWRLSDEELNQGRAGAGLFYSHNKVFVVGGEQRGIFLPETGLCRYEKKSNGSWKKWWGKGEVQVVETKGGLLPRRMPFPVNSIEFIEVSSDRQPYIAKWTIMKDEIPDELMYRYAIVPRPATNSIFLFGGVIETSHSNAVTQGGDNCFGVESCLPLSDHIYVYSDQLINDDALPLLRILFLVLSFSSLIFAIICTIRWRKENKDSKVKVETEIELSEQTTPLS